MARPNANDNRHWMPFSLPQFRIQFNPSRLSTSFTYLKASDTVAFNVTNSDYLSIADFITLWRQVKSEEALIDQWVIWKTNKRWCHRVLVARLLHSLFAVKIGSGVVWSGWALHYVIQCNQSKPQSNIWWTWNHWHFGRLHELKQYHSEYTRTHTGWIDWQQSTK